MRLKQTLIVLILIFASLADSKRSRGRSRGSSGSSSTFWNRKNKGSSDSQHGHTKPSAPREPEVKKETAKVQKSAPVNSGRPIGWNVDNSPAKAANVNPSHSSPSLYNNPHSAGAYPHQYSGGYQHNPGYGGHNPNYPNYGQNSHGAYPGNNYGNSYNPQSVGGYGGHVGGYGGHPGGYGGNAGGYGGNAGGYGGHPGGYGGNMGGYGGHSGGYGGHPGGYGGNVGGYGGNMGGYGGNMGGYGGHTGGYGSPGGYGGYPQQSGGMGGMFGGNKHGFGGYGGLAPYGAGYGMKKSGGFLGTHAFRNILGGLAVGYLVSGLISTPYRVYNSHNLPKEREEIKLPANVLTLCSENATNICVPGTTAICTTDNKILCVTTMSSATPCKDNKGEMCVNSTIPCMGPDDPLCQNKTTTDNTTSVDLPCFTNMTLEAGSGSLPTNVTLPKGDATFCVTTMAVPDPSIPKDTKNFQNQANQSGWDPSTYPFGRYAEAFDEFRLQKEQNGWDPSKFGSYSSAPYGISG